MCTHDCTLISAWHESLHTAGTSGKAFGGCVWQGNMRKQSSCVPLGTNEITTWPEMGGALFILKSESQIPPFDGLSWSINFYSIRLDLDGFGISRVNEVL